jgi:Domain of unknown function (DUF4440)
MVKTMASVGTWAVAVWLVAVPPSEAQTARGVPNAVKDELLAITQQLLDAVATGDKVLWGRHLADDCVITVDDGRTLSKSQMLEELSPLPKGFSGTIKVVNPQVRGTDAAVVITYDLDEHETVLGQELTAEYHTTDTWLRREGGWRLVASQALRKSADPPVGTADPGRYPDYAGTYALSPEVMYSVSADGARLFGQRSGRDREELLPETPDVFFRKGNPGRRIFVRDDQGKVVRMVDRLAGRDLVWTRTSSISAGSR